MQVESNEAAAPAGLEAAQQAGGAIFELNTSRQFPQWLAQMGGSLALTTYQAGKLIMLGTKPDGSLNIYNRTLNRCMGLCVHDNSLYVSTLSEILRFENAMSEGQTSTAGEDALFVPQMGWYTGDLDIHDLAMSRDGLVFVNTLFGCLASPSASHSFKPVWRPPFIDRLAAEDRCHLNGLTLRDGVPAYATAVSTSNIADGWRDNRHDGGVVLDVQTNEIVASGLSMPHSPRWHDGKLWLHNSGKGEFGYIDFDAGAFVPMTFCPGFLRGLSFVGPYAIAGLSQPRGNKTFSGLALQDRLEAEKVAPRCGLMIIDTRTGDIVHWVRIEGVVSELYDVVFVPGIANPAMIGFRSDEIRRIISIEE